MEDDLGSSNVCMWWPDAIMTWKSPTGSGEQDTELCAHIIPILLPPLLYCIVDHPSQRKSVRHVDFVNKIVFCQNNPFSTVCICTKLCNYGYKRWKKTIKFLKQKVGKKKHSCVSFEIWCFIISDKYINFMTRRSIPGISGQDIFRTMITTGKTVSKLGMYSCLEWSIVWYLASGYCVAPVSPKCLSCVSNLTLTL